jgi:hypothetical protein
VRRRSVRTAVLRHACDEAPPCMRWRGLALSHHASLARFPAPASCGVTCPADLADRLPGRRLRRDSRRATFADRSPGHLVRLGSRLAALTSRSPSCLVRRGVRPSPWQPIARPPCATWRSCPRNPASPVNAGLLDPPGVLRVTPEADPVFSSEEFLRPAVHATQALSAITSRFFCHPQDILRLSPVHPKSPPRRAQVIHKIPGITTGHGDPRAQ